MRSIIRVRLRSDELALLLTELKDIRGLTYLQMCDALDVPRTRHNRLQKQMLTDQRFSPEEIQQHVSRLDTVISDAEWRQIAARQPVLVRSIYSPSIDLPNALSGWLALDGTQQEFEASRTGANGSFLILRLRRPVSRARGEASHRIGDTEIARELICSWMLIRGPSVRSPVSEFLTQRPTSSKVRSIRGVIFQKQNLIFSFGKSRHGIGFRSTILSPENRSIDRFDMFGARLGLQEDPEVPFAYPIYCYQLKRPRSRAQIARLTGYKSYDDEHLVREVNGLGRIIERLRTAARSGYGVHFGQ